MRRREFISVIGGAAVWPGIANAQRSALPVVGFLGFLSPAEAADQLAAVQQGLNGMGFLDGRNVAVEARWAESQYDRLPALAAELVRRRAVVIVATGSGASALAAKAPAAGVTRIVFVEGDLDPVKSGLVSSLAQPDANITGVFLSHPTLLRKRLETLREVAFGIDAVGMLVNPNPLDPQTQTAQAQEAARALGLQLKIVKATNEDEIDNAFSSTLVSPQVGALVVGDDVLFLSQRDRIVDAVSRAALPAIYPHRAYVVAGGLMSYAADPSEAYRKAGGYAARLLGGQKPVELPVLQPTQFELVINRKTAAALQIPDSMVASADRIIE